MRLQRHFTIWSGRIPVAVSDKSRSVRPRPTARCVVALECDFIEGSEHTEKEFLADRGQVPLLREGSDPGNTEPAYTLRRGPRHELVAEEIEIIKRVSDAVTERTSFDATLRERMDATAELYEEDLELAALMDRVEELARSNDESVLFGLARLSREEEERGEGGEGDGSEG
jgi:hypothetical protein